MKKNFPNKLKNKVLFILGTVLVIVILILSLIISHIKYHAKSDKPHRCISKTESIVQTLINHVGYGKNHTQYIEPAVNNFITYIKSNVNFQWDILMFKINIFNIYINSCIKDYILQINSVWDNVENFFLKILTSLLLHWDNLDLYLMYIDSEVNRVLFTIFLLVAIVSLTLILKSIFFLRKSLTFIVWWFKLLLASFLSWLGIFVYKIYFFLGHIIWVSTFFWFGFTCWLKCVFLYANSLILPFLNSLHLLLDSVIYHNLWWFEWLLNNFFYWLGFILFCIPCIIGLLVYNANIQIIWLLWSFSPFQILVFYIFFLPIYLISCIIYHLLTFLIDIFYLGNWFVYKIKIVGNYIVSHIFYIIKTLLINLNNTLENVTIMYLPITVLTLIKIILVLIAVAYFTIGERKGMAGIQRRKGPEVVGIWGLLQPIADALKLLSKKLLVPTRSNKIIFIVAPLIILILSLVSWSVIPFSMKNKSEKILNLQSANELVTFSLDEVVNVSTLNYTILFLFAISSLVVYGIIIAGWASNSKYAFLGSLRSAAQMISYEVTLGAALLPVIVIANSFELAKIVETQSKLVWFVVPLFPGAVIFFVSMLAETNRTPFDLPEAEAELVAGYNVEYTSIIFAMFFLAEYSNMLLMSTLLSILYFGGWHFSLFFTLISFEFILATKITTFCFLFVLIRATVPRFKYNQLMNMAWKSLMPIALSYFTMFISVGFLLLNTPALN